MLNHLLPFCGSDGLKRPDLGNGLTDSNQEIEKDRMKDVGFSLLAKSALTARRRRVES